jgi:hypothetical protein
MKIYLDASVLITDDRAAGRVSGVIELAAVPPIGSHVMLAKPLKPVGSINVRGFTGALKVTDLRFEAVIADAVSISASLEDICVSSIEEARQVMQFLEQGFDLSADEYLDE